MNQQLVAVQEPAQLFHHLPEYRVVICIICRHAVPPRAINRHLKEIHGMHHSLRPNYVKFVENLDLCEPEEVTLPGDNDFPIPELPVFYGLRCSFEDCGHLCLTERRMKSHWASAQHQYVKTEEPCCSVSVQTFFRGNLLKYFSRSAQPESSDVDLRLEGSKKGDAGLRDLIDLSCGWEPANEPSQLPIPFVPDRQIHADDTAKGLLRHYQTSTSATIATNISEQVLWQQIGTQLAGEHEFLLLAVLALTSLHLAHLNPGRRSELAVQATSYQDRAMPIFREAMAAPTPDNCHAIVVFHHLLVLYTFAAERHNDDLLLVSKDSDEVVPRWLHFIRSACVMLCDVWDWIEAGPCRTLAFAWEAPFKISKAYEGSILELLLALIPPASSPRAWTVDTIDLYKKAASELALAFACSESSPNHFTIWDVLRIWPVRVSTEFMTLLQEEHPCALVLLAHYTVLLQRIDDLWYFRGRASGLLRIIYRKLDPYWYACIPPVLTLFVA